MFYSVSRLAQANAAAGGHFFDEDTMRFFGSRICGGGEVFGGRAFVTSEEVWGDDARSYSVRVLEDPTDPRTISTWGQFDDRRTALRFAGRVGALSGDEWAAALALVDLLCTDDGAAVVSAVDVAVAVAS
jgi:hypothetical protein